MIKRCRRGDKIWIRGEVYRGGDQPSDVSMPFVGRNTPQPLLVGTDYKLEKEHPCLTGCKCHEEARMTNKMKAREFISRYYETLPRETMVDMLHLDAMSRLRQFGTTEREVWEETADDAGFELTWDDE